MHTTAAALSLVPAPALPAPAVAIDAPPAGPPPAVVLADPTRPGCTWYVVDVPVDLPAPRSHAA